VEYWQEENRRTRRKNCLSATLSATNSIWTAGREPWPPPWDAVDKPPKAWHGHVMMDSLGDYVSLCKQLSVSLVVEATVCSQAKRLSKQGKRWLHLLEVLVEGMLYCSSRKHSCLVQTFPSCYYRSTSVERMRATLAIVTMTRAPILQTRQNWHNHLPNETFLQNG
jgi:hypothetical protein